MIEITQGNLLTSDADALINTVNTQGVMGKGIALQFKKAYPNMFKVYVASCKRKEFIVGKVQVIPLNSITPPFYIINFPTKQEWSKPSRMEYIEDGLVDLADTVRSLGICSIAMPPLGCGNGGLEWSQVKMRIEKTFASLPDVKVLLYAPSGSPQAQNIINHTERPKMTYGRAVVLKLLQQYCVLGYELTLLEVHKLLYFLQEVGEPLRLRFKKQTYGPYADNLRHVLHQFEGHFTIGFGDGKNNPNTTIQLIPSAIEEAEQLLANSEHKDKLHADRLTAVKALIEGYESPYGMELLATVHWLSHYESCDIHEQDSIVMGIRKWSPRKEKLMKPEHIELARKKLMAMNVITSDG
ncbi:MAG: macro domain-containing protein [Legionella sp.]|nr:macro domain-containing protein [Legionella sp.]